MRLRLWFLGAVGLVQDELDGSASLNEPSTRDKIEAAIRARPGITIRELARKAGTTWPNAKYHAVRLEMAGIIGTRAVGRHRVCFPVSGFDEDLLKARAMLEEPTARKIALYLVEHQGIDRRQVMEGTQTSQRVAYYHLKRFLDMRLLEHANDELYGGLRPTTLLYNALRED